MRLALSVLVLLLALPAFLPVSAQVPLGADLDNAVTIFEGPAILFIHYEQGKKAREGRELVLALPFDDVDRLCSIADYVYVVAEYSDPKGLGGHRPALILKVAGIREYPPYYAVPPAGKYVREKAKAYWVVDCGDLRRAHQIVLELYFDVESVDSGWGSLTIERVMLAPPKAASTPATPTATVVVARLSGGGGSQDGNRHSLVLVSVAVAAVFAVAAFVAGMLFGRKAAAILLLLMLPMALPIVGVAQTSMSAIMLSGAGTLTIPPNSTVRLGSSQPVLLLFNETVGLKIVWSGGRTITVSADNVTLGGDYVVEIDTSGRAEPLEVSYVEVSKRVPLAGGRKIFEGKITVDSKFVHVNVEPGKEYKIVVESVGDIYLRYIAVWDGYVEPPKDQVFWPRSKAKSLGSLLYFGVVSKYDMIKVRPERSTITIAISIGVRDGYWRVEVYGEGGGGGGHEPKPQPTYTPPYTQPHTVTETQTVTQTQTVVQQGQGQQLSGVDTKTLLYLVGGAVALVFIVLLVVVVVVLGRGK